MWYDQWKRKCNISASQVFPLQAEIYYCLDNDVLMRAHWKYSVPYSRKGNFTWNSGRGLSEKERT